MKLKDILIFAAGVAIGGTAAFFIAYDIAEKEANEKLEELRKQASGYNQDKPDISEVAEKTVDLNVNGQTVEFNKVPFDPHEVIANLTEPYKTDDTHETEVSEPVIHIRDNEIIEEEDIDTSEFPIVYITMYADDVLADTNYNVLDVDDTIGYEFLDYISPNRTLYVKNYMDETVYAVDYDSREFYVLTGIDPNAYREDDYE